MLWRKQSIRCKAFKTGTVYCQPIIFDNVGSFMLGEPQVLTESEGLQKDSLSKTARYVRLYCSRA